MLTTRSAKVGRPGGLSITGLRDCYSEIPSLSNSIEHAPRNEILAARPHAILMAVNKHYRRCGALPVRSLQEVFDDPVSIVRVSNSEPWPHRLAANQNTDRETASVIRLVRICWPSLAAYDRKAMPGWRG